MKHLLLEKQLSHYRQFGFIEFENFLTDPEILLLESEVNSSLIIKTDSIRNPPPSQQYLLGKDLYLENKNLLKFCLKKKLAELAKGLCHESVLRLAFDQAFFFNTDYTPPFPLQGTLESIFSYQGLVNVVLFQLGDLDVNVDEVTEPTLQPLKKGNVIFIDARKEVDFSPLFAKDTKLYMFGYAKLKAQYILNKADPLTHELKKRGFSFGDVLSEKAHPIC